MKRKIIGASICLAAIAFSGCEAPNWEDPAYVSKQLTEGDSAQQALAMERISQMPEDKQKEMTLALAAVYMQGGGSQKDAMQYLVQFRDARAKDAYLAELKSNSAGYAAAAATALGELKLEETIAPMLEVLASTDKNDTKLGIVQAFAFMPSPQLVAPLTELLKLDVDNNPIALHSYSCDVIGEIALAHPDAITDEVVKQVTLAMFYGNRAGQTVDRECGLAVQKMGSKATPELLKIFRLEREDVQALMMKYDSTDSPFPQNHPKLIASKRLASLHAKEAAEPMIADLKGVKEAPKTLAGQQAVNWRLKEGQTTSEIMYALGDIGDPAAVEALSDVVTNKIAENWDDITDGLIELQLRQDAASALNRIGDRKALAPLLEMAEKGVVLDFERRAAMLEKGGNPVKEIERYQFNWMVAAEYAYLATSAEKPAFEKLVETTKGKYPELGAKMGSYLVAFDVHAECSAKGDEAAQAKCYGSKVNDENEIIRAKAAWELSRLSGDAARAELVTALGTTHLNTREILTFAGYRNPGKELVGKLDELIKAHEGANAVEKRLDSLRLQLLRGWLLANGHK